MKVLLTGGSGQVGQEIIKSKPEKIEIINPSRKTLDLSDYRACKKIVEEYTPDWIINCGAYTQVDDAEQNILLSQKINGYAPAAFAEAINKINTNLLHISTDFVFDGNQNFPYKENQKRNPLSQYGASKALGEELIEKRINNIEKATILRTSWVLSPIGKNFIFTMLKLHSKNSIIKVVSDQIGCPTSAKELAKVCWRIIELKKKKKLPFILHWSDAGVASWFDIAVAVGELAKEIDINKKDAIVLPINTSEYPTLAQRPKYSLLNTNNTSSLLDINPIHWRKNLRNILIEYKNTKKI
jgi:dTDP-4-dehydrorhamnose reductase